jgi:four helix bundle protein
MATITRFEDIDAWQKARELTAAIYRESRTGAFAKDFGLRDQICRAVVSVMSNIAEGFDRDGNREFMNFLSIAKGSAAEVTSQLYIAKDIGYIDEERFDELYKLAKEVGSLIGGFMKYLGNSKMAGNKFKHSKK